MRFILAMAVLCAACGNPAEKETTSNTASKTENISPTRENVRKEPVAKYDVPAPGELNKEWRFTVKIYETSDRFRFNTQMQYQEVTGDIDLKIPNMGFEPKVEIRNGNTPLECIIGFLDDKNAFREYKKVLIQDGNLKTETLKSYAVYQETKPAG